jgi:hypothetical protein
MCHFSFTWSVLLGEFQFYWSFQWTTLLFSIIPAFVSLFYISLIFLLFSFFIISLILLSIYFGLLFVVFRDRNVRFCLFVCLFKTFLAVSAKLGHHDENWNQKGKPIWSVVWHPRSSSVKWDHMHYYHLPHCRVAVSMKWCNSSIRVWRGLLLFWDRI